MTGRVVALAVLVLAAVATADAVRGSADSRVEAGGREAARPAAEIALVDTREYVAAGRPRTRVLRGGRVHLTPEQIDEAFPAPLEGVLFDIAHVASAPDGTVALAIYNFGMAAPARNAIELWRDGRLVGAFAVPPGTFGRGLAFTEGGSIAALPPRGSRVLLFGRDGRPLGDVPLPAS